MWLPLAGLAVLALASGWIGLPGMVQVYQYLHYSRPGMDATLHPHPNILVIGCGTAAGLIGMALGWVAYQGRKFNWFRGPATGGAAVIYNASLNKFYFDELYWNLLIKPLFVVTKSLKLVDIILVDGLVRSVGWLGRGLAILWGLVDKYIVDGIVNGVAQVAGTGGKWLRLTQTGQIQNYILVVFAGIALLTWWMLALNPLK